MWVAGLLHYDLVGDWDWGLDRNAPPAFRSLIAAKVLAVRVLFYVKEG